MKDTRSQETVDVRPHDKRDLRNDSAAKQTGYSAGRKGGREARSSCGVGDASETHAQEQLSWIDHRGVASPSMCRRSAGLTSSRRRAVHLLRVGLIAQLRLRVDERHTRPWNTPDESNERLHADALCAHEKQDLVRMLREQRIFVVVFSVDAVKPEKAARL